jgi:hypothetical protein
MINTSNVVRKNVVCMTCGSPLVTESEYVTTHGVRAVYYDWCVQCEMDTYQEEI